MAFALLALDGAARADLPLPADPFRPSSARTVDGAPIPSAAFIPAARCAGCHAEAYAEWSQSLHRNAGREPFYKDSVDLLTGSRPIEFSRHCESCHLPVALLSGALKTGSREPRPLDDEGVTCSVCHSIVDARLDGTGSYTVAAPALLVDARGRARRDASDAEILADLPAHRRAVMRPLLKSPELCATCHKSSVPTDLSGWEFAQRGFDVYDEWQQSARSNEAIATAAPTGVRQDCRSCHMERVAAAAGDAAAKGGQIASHRWRGANTAVPLFYGDRAQLDATRAFLQSGVVTVDVFAVENLRSGARAEGLGAGRGVAVAPGDAVAVEVVVAGEGVGHSFPPELRDLYDARVELRVTDGSGREIHRAEHAWRQELIDRAVQPVAHHEVWLAIAKGCDDRVPSGAPDLQRFRFTVPAGAATDRIRVSASVVYRRFNRAYTAFVLAPRGGDLEPPAVTMAEHAVSLDGATVGGTPGGDAAARAWRYGLALLGRRDRRAPDALARAGALAPNEPELLIDRAAAELRAARTATPVEHARRALALLDRAAAMPSPPARARYWRALAQLAVGDTAPAITALRELAAAFPRDREVHRRLGLALAAGHAWDEARAEQEAVLAVDPLDADALQQLATIAARQGRDDEAHAWAARYWLLSRIASPSVEGPCGPPR